MRYSDTFDNEFVGYFGGIPVYHPLEVVLATHDDNPRDFACGPENLLICGGRGEYPGIVVKAPGDDRLLRPRLAGRDPISLVGRTHDPSTRC